MGACSDLWACTYLDDQILRYTTDRGEDSRTRGVITVDEWSIYLKRFGPLEVALGAYLPSSWTNLAPQCDTEPLPLLLLMMMQRRRTGRASRRTAS